MMHRARNLVTLSSKVVKIASSGKEMKPRAAIVLHKTYQDRSSEQWSSPQGSSQKNLRLRTHCQVSWQCHSALCYQPLFQYQESTL